MKDAIFWDVSPCGSCKNQRFGGTYRLHLQGENNRRTKNMLTVASNCSMLQRINHCVRREAVEWDILHGKCDRIFLQRCPIRLLPFSHSD
jgi:hypothetical protein